MFSSMSTLLAKTVKIKTQAEGETETDSAVSYKGVSSFSVWQQRQGSIWDPNTPMQHNLNI